jgi:hypothetical protein
MESAKSANLRSDAAKPAADVARMLAIEKLAARTRREFRGGRRKL